VTDDAGRRRSLALVGRENGPRVPGSPAVLLARKLLSGRLSAVGAFPCVGFLGAADYAEFLAPYHSCLVKGEGGARAS
jgi:hypothetical protein